jgi:hypothetical protein
MLRESATSAGPLRESRLISSRGSSARWRPATWPMQPTWRPVTFGREQVDLFISQSATDLMPSLFGRLLTERMLALKRVSWIASRRCCPKQIPSESREGSLVLRWERLRKGLNSPQRAVIAGCLSSRSSHNSIARQEPEFCESMRVAKSETTDSRMLVRSEPR